jgi:hypothetical protein
MSCIEAAYAIRGHGRGRLVCMAVCRLDNDGGALNLNKFLDDLVGLDVGDIDDLNFLGDYDDSRRGLKNSGKSGSEEGNVERRDGKLGISVHWDYSQIAICGHAEQERKYGKKEIHGRIQVTDLESMTTPQRCWTPPQANPNPKNILQPQWIVAVDACLKSLRKTRRSISATLACYSTETEILNTVYYKSKNQHKNALFWRNVAQLRRFAVRIEQVGLAGVLDTTRAAFYSNEIATSSAL